MVPAQPSATVEFSLRLIRSLMSTSFASKNEAVAKVQRMEGVWKSTLGLW